MKHPDRVFSFKELEAEDDLVEAMTNHHWPICYGFYHGNHLFLGDGDSEDDPEYAAATVDKTEGHQGVHGREVGRIRPRGCPQMRCAGSSRISLKAIMPARTPSRSVSSRSGIIAAPSAGWKRIRQMQQPG